MLFLQLVLLAVLLPGGDSEDDSQEPISFRIILTTSFYSSSSTQNQGSAWLDELQTHGWNNKTGAFRYLQPWSKGNFSNEELLEVQNLFYTYTIRSPSTFHNHIRDWQLEYPFQIQLVLGCDSHFGEASAGFLQLAYQGSDLLSFQNTSWRPSPEGGSRAQKVCSLFNEYHVFIEIVHKLLFDSCPRFLLGLLDAGKAYLQRQGVLGCESQGGSWPVLPGETQQSRRPGHGPPLGAAPLRGLGLPGGDRAPGAPGRPGVVALEALESPLETSVHRLPFGAGSQPPRLQHLPKPSSALTSWPLPVANSSLVLPVDRFSV
uniref:T-cell surface glycoprotein CD1a-like isoform X3 n=1 Tax=Nyctereutes procyonoides TaxID=34880 RepID=UPI0024445F7D|nr:T-cell surface glycoprotein CD1a-like isoform X3 [Nyctereutes procyonoides]